MRNWLAMGAMIALLAGACATQEVYRNPTVTPDGSAVLSTTAQGPALVNLLAVDGRSCRNLGNSVELAPGLRTIDFRISQKLSPNPIPWTEVHEHMLSFEAEAGHAYTLEGEFDRSIVHVWIADAATGDRVAEVHLKRA